MVNWCSVVSCWDLLTHLLYLIWKLRAKRKQSSHVNNLQQSSMVFTETQTSHNPSLSTSLRLGQTMSTVVPDHSPLLFLFLCFQDTIVFLLLIFFFFFFSLLKSTFFSGLCWCITASRYSSALLSTRVGSRIPDSALGQRDWSDARQWHQWSLKLHPLFQCVCVCLFVL